MKKYLTGVIVAAGMMLGATVANAATLYFGTGNGTAGTNSYSFTDIGSGVTAVATPLSNRHSQTIGQYGSGLGVGTGGSDSNHEVDGSGYLEAIRLTFSEEVTVTSILFGAVGTNDKFAYRVDKVAGDPFSSNYDIVGGNYNDNDEGYYSFALPGIVGTVFDIAALEHYYDFKLRGVEFSRTSVTPLPPAVLMFGAALAGLGWFKRRKKAA